MDFAFCIHEKVNRGISLFSPPSLPPCIPPSPSPSSTFGMVDSEETCCVVMVYNTADSWGVLIGDSVVVPEPQVKRHSVAHNSKVCVCGLHTIMLQYVHGSDG